MVKLYLPDNQKTTIVYQVRQYWQGEEGSRNHGFYESALFKHRSDAETFLDAVKERWKTGKWPSDLGRNADTDEPEILEVEILEEYAPPGNGDDYSPKTYASHVCREN